MQLMVPASGILGASVYSHLHQYGFEWGPFFVNLNLSSFSLTIGTENLGLQNLQRPSSVNVSMQVTSVDYYPQAKQFGAQLTPWARKVIVPWVPGEGEEYVVHESDYNELYVAFKINQNFYKTVFDPYARDEYQIIRVTDIKFDIPEYSAVSRTDSATLNTFTLNGVADAREPVLIGPATKRGATNVLYGNTTTGGAVTNGAHWPRSFDYYTVLQSGEMH